MRTGHHPGACHRRIAGRCDQFQHHVHHLRRLRVVDDRRIMVRDERSSTAIDSLRRTQGKEELVSPFYWEKAGLHPQMIQIWQTFLIWIVVDRQHW
jgi:hypothetical protein